MITRRYEPFEGNLRMGTTKDFGGQPSIQLERFQWYFRPSAFIHEAVRFPNNLKPQTDGLPRNRKNCSLIAKRRQKDAALHLHAH